MTHKAKRCLQRLIVLLAALALLASPALAAENGSLALYYPYDGVMFYAARVADIAADGSYTLAGDFAAYAVELPGSDPRDTAATLAAYAARDGIAPTAAGKTAGGCAVLTGLADGLYLVTGEPHAADGQPCTPVPFLTEITGGRANAAVKYEFGGDETVSVTVQKVWSGDAGRDRPGSVTVQLLRNGEVCAAARLSAFNGWKHTWKGLSEGDRWQVTEESVPEGYTVSVSQSGYTFTVTNTGTPAAPAATERPGASNPPAASAAGLPQTGQLWWPVALLLAGGLALLTAGWLRGREKEEGHEEQDTTK